MKELGDLEWGHLSRFILNMRNHSTSISMKDNTIQKEKKSHFKWYRVWSTLMFFNKGIYVQEESVQTLECLAQQVTRNSNVCLQSVSPEKWYQLSFLVGAITESPVVIYGVWWAAGANLLVISSCQMLPCFIALKYVSNPLALRHCPTVSYHAPMQSEFIATLCTSAVSTDM